MVKTSTKMSRLQPLQKSPRSLSSDQQITNHHPMIRIHRAPHDG